MAHINQDGNIHLTREEFDRLAQEHGVWIEPEAGQRRRVFDWNADTDQALDQLLGDDPRIPAEPCQQCLTSPRRAVAPSTMQDLTIAGLIGRASQPRPAPDPDLVSTPPPDRTGDHNTAAAKAAGKGLKEGSREVSYVPLTTFMSLAGSDGEYARSA